MFISSSNSYTVKALQGLDVLSVSVVLWVQGFSVLSGSEVQKRAW